MADGYADIFIKIPEYVRRAMERLLKSGYKVYAVGGCVRDSIIGRNIHDWDLASSAPAEITETVFRHTIPTGKKYGTVTVISEGRHIEVTTFRTEGGYKDTRHPGKVEFVNDIDTDLSRRDFTMNAMAADIDGRVIDPFNGAGDIRSGLIRCVGDPCTRFSEDALRMFRAVRFAAELGFKVEERTQSALFQCADLSSAVSAERVREETEKILMSDRPETVCIALDAGMYGRYCGAVHSAELLHGSFADIKKVDRRRCTRWCAFCALLMDSGAVTDPRQFLKELRIDGKTVSVVSDSCRILMRGIPPTRLGLKRLAAEEGREAAFCAAAVSDVMRGGSSSRILHEITTSGECLSIRELSVSGTDIIETGISDGREVGQKLCELLDHVLEHPEDNTKEKLLAMIKE